MAKTNKYKVLEIKRKLPHACAVRPPCYTYYSMRTWSCKLCTRLDGNRTTCQCVGIGGTWRLRNLFFFHIMSVRPRAGPPPEKDLDSDRCNNRLWVRSSGPTSGLTSPPSVDSYGSIAHDRQHYDESKIGCERIAPDILNAFKSNPYTQSLQSWY